MNTRSHIRACHDLHDMIALCNSTLDDVPLLTDTYKVLTKCLQSAHKVLTKCSRSAYRVLTQCPHSNNNNNLQAFQLVVLARYLLGVPKP